MKSSNENWTIAVRKNETKCDTLWVSNQGRYCTTDGTNPRQVHGNIEAYIIDREALQKPLKVNDGDCPIEFPRLNGRSVGQTIYATLVIQDYFLAVGVIASPFQLVLASDKEQG